MTINMGKEALRLAEEHGFLVFPVHPPQPGGGRSNGKLPAIRGWPEAATLDSKQINEWWRRWPNASIGVVTGERSGVFVLDVDLKQDGFDPLRQLVERLQCEWPNTLFSITGSGGLHFYFKYDERHPVMNGTSSIGPGLDVRGEGGYVVAPPSLHATGNRYRWGVAE